MSAIDELARQLPVETSRAEVVDRTLMHVAARRFGSEAAPHALDAWNEFSRAFSEFPYHIGVVYSAPLQVGPGNLLWEKATGYTASMVGLPYDDLERWRGIYPPETFANQLEKVADGFDSAVGKLRNSTAKLKLTAAEKETLASELRVADAAAIHFRCGEFPAAGGLDSEIGEIFARAGRIEFGLGDISSGLDVDADGDAHFAMNGAASFVGDVGQDLFQDFSVRGRGGGGFGRVCRWKRVRAQHSRGGSRSRSRGCMGRRAGRGWQRWFFLGAGFQRIWRGGFRGRGRIAMRGLARGFWRRGRLRGSR